MADRRREPSAGETVEKVARLIEQSSFGTVGARQLRDRTGSVSRDRALLQAYFSATPEGRAWWGAHRDDADALYAAAGSLSDGNPEDRAISGRLANLAAALGHPEACASAASEGGRPFQACPERVPSAEAGDGVPAGRAGGTAGRRPGTGTDWRSFERFFVTFLEPLTDVLSDETWLRADRSREVLLAAMTAAFDNWEVISATGRPEEWVLGYALRQQRRDIVRYDFVSRSIDVLAFDCLHTRKTRWPTVAASDADLVILTDVDIRITGAMAAAVQEKVRADRIALPSPVAQIVVECKQYLRERHTDAISTFSGKIDVDEAVTGFYAHNFRSTVRLAVLLVGEANQAEEVAVAAFNAAHRTWQQTNRSFDKTVTILRQSLINRARAVNRYRDAWRSAQQRKALEQCTAERNQDFGSIVLAALQRLSVRQREALALRYYADLDISQIADAMGVSTPAALTHMEKGMEELRLMLGGIPAQHKSCSGQRSLDINLEGAGGKIP